MNEKKEVKRSRGIGPLWSLVLFLFAVGLYGFRVDQTYLVTAWPPGLYLGLGLVLSIWSRQIRWYLLTGWLVFGFVFVDETKSYPRFLLPIGKPDFRVVSLNCAGGSPLAAAEVASQHPDLVLLQESPSEKDLAKLARDLYGSEGSYIKGPDASIVAHGVLDQVKFPRSADDFVLATWYRKNAPAVNVMSLRLTPPTLRLDFYDPEAWQEMAANRAARRKEVEGIRTELEQGGIIPDLLGGDFNTGPDQITLNPLVSAMTDAFASVGRGYGATCVNPYPCVVRIDQIWSGPNLKATNAFVAPTQNSDHRMLVVDFLNPVLPVFRA